jgi:hypothetical protein
MSSIAVAGGWRATAEHSAATFAGAPERAPIRYWLGA